MRHISRRRSISTWIFVSLIMTTAILLAICLGSPYNVWAQGGAFDSTITLQMPFITGETWTVGGAGSFYGDGDIPTQTTTTMPQIGIE